MTVSVYGQGSHDFSGLEFVPGTVVGARSFSVDKLGRLRGVNYKQVWHPGENEAECRKMEASGGIVSFSGSFRLTAGLSGYGYPFYPSMSGTTEKKPARSRLQKLLRLNPIQTTATTVETENVEPEVQEDPAPKIEPVDDLTTCGHGFYAYYDGSNDYYQEGMVSGVVEGYGEVVVGTRGFKCMKARLIALYIPPELPLQTARLVARNYPDLPVYSSFSDMIEAHPTDGRVPEISPETVDDFWTRDA